MVAPFEGGARQRRRPSPERGPGDVRLHDPHPRGMDAAAGTDTARRLAQAHGLNPREEQALRLMLHGASNREIASGMLISESTAKKHVNAVYRKLGVANRMGLVHRACSALP
ncbi:response regulator transcription factor [Candidatus Collinsella stercoripullorum]|uniref:response regulator transcription factor n=1 Tax=Candidatus Collinsella stercoripullorum TaxID=2838522 RepID=UPI0022E3575B|nr:helix-turn-helix transcriptional regulator [Candidatus Collinsella stercoripullorum]